MGQQCCHLTPSGQPSLTSLSKGVGSWADTEGVGVTSPSSASQSQDEPADESWKISLSNLEFLKILGKGHSETSWEGKWKDVQVEIRTVEADKDGTKQCIEEGKLLRGLRHPHFLNVLGICTEGRQLHVVIERPLTASLLQPLLCRSDLPLHLHVLTQVAGGLAYLEQHKLILLEISTRNIYITSDLMTKLPVYGFLSRPDVCIADLQLSFLGLSMAPEVQKTGMMSVKSSVWAFGMFMLEVLMKGRPQFHEYMGDQTMMQMINKGHGFPPPNNCPPALYELIKMCLVPPPAKRPTFASLRDSLQKDAARYSQEDLMTCLEASS